MLTKDEKKLSHLDLEDKPALNDFGCQELTKFLKYLNESQKPRSKNILLPDPNCQNKKKKITKKL